MRWKGIEYGEWGRVVLADGVVIPDNSRIKVIELDPVLDLIGRLVGHTPTLRDERERREAEDEGKALLTAHGRNGNE